MNARETNRRVVVEACQRLLALNESHSLAGFGLFAESKALARLVLDAIEPAPSGAVFLHLAMLDACAAEIGAAALRERERR